MKLMDMNGCNSVDKMERDRLRALSDKCHVVLKEEPKVHGRIKMTEDEVIKILKIKEECIVRRRHACGRNCKKCDWNVTDGASIVAYDKAIAALSEIQDQREYVEPRKDEQEWLRQEGRGMTTERIIRAVEAVAEKHKNDSVYTCQTNITNMCRDIIPKLELLAAYETIGTVAECQKAVEKQRAKKPVLNENSNVLFCPVCERKVRKNYDLHCSGCGQDIDWSDE